MYRQTLFNRPDYSSRYPVYDNYNSMISDGEGLFAEQKGQPVHLGSYQEYAAKVRRAYETLHPGKKLAQGKINSIAKKLKLPSYITDKEAKVNPYYSDYYKYAMSQQAGTNMPGQTIGAPMSTLMPGVKQYPILPQLPQLQPRPTMAPVYPTGMRRPKAPEPMILGTPRSSVIQQLNDLRRQEPCTFTKQYLLPMREDRLLELWRRYNPGQYQHLEPLI